MSEVRCPQTTDVGAYLLGGLLASEAAMLRIHIDSCADCSAALGELQPLTTKLSAIDLRQFAGMEVEVPSSNLGARIVAVAAQDDPETANVSALTPHGRQGVHGRQGRQDLQGHGGRRVPWKAVAAAALAFGVGTGTGFVVKPAAAPTTRPEWPPIPGYDTRSQRVNFTGLPASGPEAWALVSAGPAGTYVALHTKRLTVGSTYRWWLEQADGTRVPLGSFKVPADQKGWLVCPGSTSVERVKVLAVGATDAAGNDVLRADLPAAQA
jgi:hypothetical protein